MAGLLEDLVRVLEAQLENYTDLLSLSDEKRQVIIENDVNSLQKITGLENTLISRNNRLEKQRDTIMGDMALVLNKKRDTLTVSAIAELVSNRQEHDMLIGVSEKIRRTLTTLKEKNDTNRALIENSLEYIDFCMNVIHDRVANPTLYPCGDDAGFIDAKQ